jgi:hypothetical protein
MRLTRYVALALLTIPAAALAANGSTGNGAQSGPHYNLNIIGHTHCSKDDLKGTSRHNIQVLLKGGDPADSLNGQLAVSIDKRNKIYLSQTFDGSFNVMDGNACDGDGAKFALPAPGSYEIFARALGKPGGAATMTTCATDAGADGVLGTADDEIVCSTDNVLLVRDKGKSTFANVTTQLTTMTVDLNGDGVLETVNIFDPALYDFFWNYDNNGLRLAQLRLYPF